MKWARRCAWLARADALGALLAAGLVLSGCGMPGAPLPPTLNLADPVTDLAATRTGDQVALTWTMPRKNTDKLLLKGDVQVRVCRREGTAGSCVAARELQVAPGAAGAFNETLPPTLAAGEPCGLTYFVELRNRNGRSAGLSNGAVVLAGEAPAPVAGLNAEVRKAGVVLRWTPAAQEPAATAIRLRRKLLTPAPVKRDSERREPNGGQLGGALAPAPEPTEQNLLVETSAQSPGRAQDLDARFGETYEYRAQRVTRVPVDGQELELDGPLTAPLQVEVKDVFPPAMPAGLAAVAIAGENGGAPSIDLSWQPDTEADLAGYIVYRREGGEDWQRISPAQPVIGPAFHDAQVLAGHTYSYAVTAIDQSGHESGRSDVAGDTVPRP
jgi:hypothetical protein